MERNSADIMGCRVDLVTLAQSVAIIKQLIAAGQPSQVITLNAEIVYQAQREPELQGIINRADLVTPDGIGIVWGGRQLGYTVPERVTGIDLLQRLCAEAPAAKWKIFLLGSAPGVAGQAARQLQAINPGIQICGYQQGYFSEEEIPSVISAIRAQRPDLIFVGLGAPKQEFWIDRHRLELGVPVCIGVGGSLDVIAGQKKRAPLWIIRLNLEWLYRLAAEPSRWRRQLVLPKFAIMILKQRYLARD